MDKRFLNGISLLPIEYGVLLSAQRFQQLQLKPVQ